MTDFEADRDGADRGVRPEDVSSDLVELAQRERSLGRLEGDDESVLRVWNDGQKLVDQRYGNKGLLAIVDLAMRDSEFRARLLADPGGVLEALPDDLDLPEVELVFHENTEETVHVVLPPEAGDITFRSIELQALLRSRTAEIIARGAEVSLGGGNWYNHGDVLADAIFGPPRNHGDR